MCVCCVNVCVWMGFTALLFTQAWALKSNSPISPESDRVLGMRGIPVLSPYSWKARLVSCCLFPAYCPPPFSPSSLLLLHQHSSLPPPPPPPLLPYPKDSTCLFLLLLRSDQPQKLLTSTALNEADTTSDQGPLTFYKHCSLKLSNTRDGEKRRSKDFFPKTHWKLGVWCVIIPSTCEWKPETDMKEEKEKEEERRWGSRGARCFNLHIKWEGKKNESGKVPWLLFVLPRVSACESVHLCLHEEIGVCVCVCVCVQAKGWLQ